jgi:hypothetical protein
MGVARDPTLSELRAQFGRSRLLAMPIAGAIAWSAAGILGAILPDADSASMALFLCMPAVFPLAIVIGRFTGDDLFGTASRNDLDTLFGHGVLMSILVWAIAIPFWMIEPSSLPLGAGILAGLMWVPLSWILQHWVGLFHAIARTVLVLAAWFLFPDHRFVAVPVVIVAVYLVSIVALAKRRRPSSASSADDASAA